MQEVETGTLCGWVVGGMGWVECGIEGFCGKRARKVSWKRVGRVLATCACVS